VRRWLASAAFVLGSRDPLGVLGVVGVPGKGGWVGGWGTGGAFLVPSGRLARGRGSGDNLTSLVSSDPLGAAGASGTRSVLFSMVWHAAGGSGFCQCGLIIRRILEL